MKDDTVSRASVLKAIDDYERLSIVSQTVRNVTSLREIVQQLPSAQPKRTEERTETHACDLISRQAAIDEILEWKTRMTAQGLADRIAMLPSAQPQPEEDCDTCKHGYFGDRQCDNCRVRFPSHYERGEEHHA